MIRRSVRRSWRRALIYSALALLSLYLLTISALELTNQWERNKQAEAFRTHLITGGGAHLLVKE